MTAGVYSYLSERNKRRHLNSVLQQHAQQVEEQQQSKAVGGRSDRRCRQGAPLAAVGVAVA